VKTLRHDQSRRQPPAVNDSPSWTPRIALIEPLGDMGIGLYAHELAEGLCDNNCRVDLYTRATTDLTTAPRRYRRLAVLGRSLLLEPRMGNLAQAPPDLEIVRPAARRRPESVERIRRWTLPTDLAVHCWRQKYDLVWTQWPRLFGGTRFWRIASALGLPLVHTVHNVLPHEANARDVDQMRPVYAASRALIVHSEFSRGELLSLYPECASKVVVEAQGLYTTYPDARGRRDAVRERLGVGPDDTVVLAFGWIRAYKNVDALLVAMTDPRMAGTVVVVAGREGGREGHSMAGDPLAATRSRASELGVLPRTRLMPGPFDDDATAELFAAADIVALPYAKSYGSAQVVLAMSLGAYVLATRTGGMDEYLAPYAAHTLLDTSDAPSVAAGMRAAMDRLSVVPREMRTAPLGLTWPMVAARTIRALEAMPGVRGARTPAS
jgi:glycosyltransferase involved in cell wall biosynthesis